MMRAQVTCCLLAVIYLMVSTSQSLKCYNRMKIEGNGFIVTNTSKDEVCDIHHACFRISTDIITPLAKIRGVKGSMVVGNCIPFVACEKLTCESLRKTGALGDYIEEVGFENCRASCCHTDLCNHDNQPITTTADVTTTSEVTTTSDVTTTTDITTEDVIMTHGMTLPKPEPETGLKCYKTMRVETMGITVMDKREEQTCPGPLSCFYLATETFTTVEGFGEVRGSLVNGDCYPTALCKQLNCTALKSSMSNLEQNVTFENCRISCCYSDLCNDIPPPTTSSVVTQTPAVMSPAMMSSVPASTNVTEGLSCYNSIQIETMGISAVETREEVKCPGPQSCFYLTADTVTTIEGIGVLKGRATMGNCIASVACDRINCDNLMMFPDQGQTKINNCHVTCCDSHLCNDGTALDQETATPSNLGECGVINRTVQADMTQVLTSPGWPGSYNGSDECDWMIEAPENHVITFTVESFRTETCCDELQFYNPDTNQVTDTLRGWKATGTTVTSQTNRVRVLFTFDETFSYEGFAMNYTAIATNSNTAIETTTSL